MYAHTLTDGVGVHRRAKNKTKQKQRNTSFFRVTKNTKKIQMTKNTFDRHYWPTDHNRNRVFFCKRREKDKERTEPGLNMTPNHNKQPPPQLTWKALPRPCVEYTHLVGLRARHPKTCRVAPGRGSEADHEENRADRHADEPDPEAPVPQFPPLHCVVHQQSKSASVLSQVCVAIAQLEVSGDNHTGVRE